MQNYSIVLKIIIYILYSTIFVLKNSVLSLLLTKYKDIIVEIIPANINIKNKL